MQYLNKFRGMLSGKKSYLVSAVMVVYSISGFLLGELETGTALMFFLNGLAVSAVRAGIAKTVTLTDLIADLVSILGKLSRDAKNQT